MNVLHGSTWRTTRVTRRTRGRLPGARSDGEPAGAGVAGGRWSPQLVAGTGAGAAGASAGVTTAVTGAGAGPGCAGSATAGEGEAVGERRRLGGGRRWLGDRDVDRGLHDLGQLVRVVQIALGVACGLGIAGWQLRCALEDLVERVRQA